jgi:hypothetical protein
MPQGCHEEREEFNHRERRGGKAMKGWTFRKALWGCTKTHREIFGIEVQTEKGGPWMKVAKDGKPVLFDNEAERDAMLKELRAEARR